MADRFHLREYRWTLFGKRVDGWRVIDQFSQQPANGTAGARSRPGGYVDKADAQRVADGLNKAHREVQAAVDKRNRRDPK